MASGYPTVNHSASWELKQDSLISQVFSLHRESGVGSPESGTLGAGRGSLNLMSVGFWLWCRLMWIQPKSSCLLHFFYFLNIVSVGFTIMLMGKNPFTILYLNDGLVVYALKCNLRSHLFNVLWEINRTSLINIWMR